MDVAELVDRLVPFNLSLDRELRIRRVGPGFADLFGGDVIGVPLTDRFIAVRPRGASAERLRARAGTLLLLASRDGTVQVRGQLVDLGADGFLLASTPWITGERDLQHGPRASLAAPHEGWADTSLQNQLLAQQRVDLERVVRELEERSGRLDAMIETAADAIITIDDRGVIERVNPAGARMFGYQAHELLGADIAMLMREADARRHADRIGRYLETGQSRVIGLGREVVAVRRDGSTFDAELTLSAFRVAGAVRFTGIIRDVSDRKNNERLIAIQAADLRTANVALEAAREQAEAASEAKSLILANVSHEIRTPMNAVLGMTGLLLGSGLTTHQQEYAETIRSASEALLTLVGDLLDFSRIEAGRLDLDDTPFGPRNVVEDVLAMLQPRARVKALLLVGIVEPAVPRMIRGDAGRLRQILVNLVDNAVKFTAAGEVIVRLAVDGDRLVASVSDTGPGIAPDVLDRLFRMFEQGDRSTTRRFGGTGLGLAVSRRLAEAMGGTLEAASPAGGGSTFMLRLPLAAATAPSWTPLSGVAVGIVAPQPETHEAVVSVVRDLGAAVVDPRRAQVVVVDAGADTRPTIDRLPVAIPAVGIVDEGHDGKAGPTRRWLHRPLRRRVLAAAVRELLGTEPAGVAGDVAPIHLVGRGGVRVLVAEDNPVNQRVVRLQLERLGHTVRMVADGREALDAIATSAFDLLFLDCQMPILDGFETARAVRGLEERESARRLPIVALTANALQEERDRCLAAGMDDYLAKPVSEQDLERMIDRWVPAAGATGQAGGSPGSGPVATG
jgi:two-component system sensor histidine kinase/response regulator